MNWYPGCWYSHPTLPGISWQEISLDSHSPYNQFKAVIERLFIWGVGGGLGGPEKTALERNQDRKNGGINAKGTRRNWALLGGWALYFLASSEIAHHIWWTSPRKMRAVSFSRPFTKVGFCCSYDIRGHSSLELELYPLLYPNHNVYMEATYLL